MAQHNELGKSGESAALNHLKAHGYRIRHTNWRYGHQELDIVADTADELVIVEVKTRNGLWDAPEDAVTYAKIKNIVAAADAYIKYFDLDLPARFDIISITGNDPLFKIEHIEDAFYPPVQTHRR
jgi:putative endonuclease